MWSEETLASSGGMAYRRSGSGPAVVLLHGIPGSSAAWRAAASALPDTLDVIVPDLLGFGASTRPRELDDLHARAQAEALARLFDDLGIDSAVVVGHDFGGPVALAFVAARPDAVRGLGLLATNVFSDAPIPFPLSLVTAPLVGPLAQRLLFSTASLRMMLRQGVGRGSRPPDRASHLGDGDQQRAIATIFAGSLIHLAELYAPIEAVLADVAVPSFVAWGDRDPFFSVADGERTAAALGVDLRLHEGTGHFLPHERPTEVAADIVDLVDRTHPGDS